MAKQTFTTGSVLTAAQMNALQANDYNWTVSQKSASYVLAAADAGTRIEMNSASPTTVTVNTGLFTAGDTLFIQNIGSGVCTVTAGTATVQKSTNASLALAQYQGGYLYFISASNAVFFADAGFTSPLTTKGDLFTWDTGNARLPVGTNGQVLTAQSSQATGLQWANAGGMTLIETINISGVATATSAAIPSTYKDLKIYIKNYRPSTNGQELLFRINGDTNTRYNWDAVGNGTSLALSSTSIRIAQLQSSSTFTGLSIIYIDDYAAANQRLMRMLAISNDSTNPSTTSVAMNNVGFYNQTSAVSTLTFFVASGNITSATVQIYGVN